MTTDRVHWTGERVVLGESPVDVELEHLQRYRLSSELCAGRVLDVACGTGYGSEILARFGRRLTVGVDISMDSLRHARSESGHHTQFVRASVEALPFRRGSFDYVVSFETIEHVQDPKKALNELKLALTRRGHLILSTPNKDVSFKLFSGLSSPFHTMEFRFLDLKRMLASRFSHVTICGQGWRKRSRAMRSLDRLLAILSELTDVPFNRVSLWLFRRVFDKLPASSPLAGWIASFLGPEYDLGPATSRRADRPKFFIAFCLADPP